MGKRKDLLTMKIASWFCISRMVRICKKLFALKSGSNRTMPPTGTHWWLIRVAKLFIYASERKNITVSYINTLLGGLAQSTLNVSHHKKASGYIARRSLRALVTIGFRITDIGKRLISTFQI